MQRQRDQRVRTRRERFGYTRFATTGPIYSAVIAACRMRALREHTRNEEFRFAGIVSQKARLFGESLIE